MFKQQKNFQEVQAYYSKIYQKYGDSFCAAPWTSFWTFADGNTASCCKIDQIIGNTNTNSLDEIANSPKLIKLRQEFLQGKKPDECRSCWDREKAGLTANQVRAYANLKGLETIYEALEHTDETGYVNKFLPTWVDILWTRDCNFSCVTCNPASSTSIEKKYLKEFKILHDKELDDEFHKFTNNPEEITKFIINHSDTINFLHFAGGEPFLQQETFVLLDKLLALGLDKNIVLHFHTNGSILHTFKGVDIVEKYLKPWKQKCKITLSHDHFGIRGEYIRYGYDEKKWLKNYNRFIDAGIEVQIQTTLSIFNIMTINELVNWYQDNLLGTWLNNFSLAQYPQSISFGQINLHEPSRIKAENNLLEACKYLQQNNKIGMSMDLENRARLVSKTTSDYKALNNFYMGINALDKKRKTDFVSTFPERNEFYKVAENYNHLRGVKL